MKLKDKLKYIPLLIFDTGYNEHIYGLEGILMPVVKEAEFIAARKFNKEVIKTLMDKANNIGFEVLDVAAESYDVSLDTRVNMANKKFSEYYKNFGNIPEERLALYIALQYDPRACNWDDTNNNVTVYYLHNDLHSKHLADLINAELIKELGEHTGTIKSTKQFILKQTTMNAILIDASFMDLKKHLGWMDEKDFIDEISDRILTGCLKYFGVKEIGVINSSQEISNDERIKELQKRVDILEKKVTPWDKM